MVTPDSPHYDLELLYGDGDIQQRIAGNNYLRKVLSDSKELLDKFSPVDQTARLVAPTLIIHGKLDQRAPISQAEALRRGLEQHGHTYEWLVEPKEGHGFYDEKHLENMYEHVFAFLQRHMKKHSGVGELVPLPAD